MKRLTLGAAIVLAVTCSASVSLAQPPPIVLVGAGGRSCGEWVSVQTKATPDDADFLKKNMLLSWVQGYVVGSAEAFTTLLAGNPFPSLATLQARYGTVSGWVFDPPDAEATRLWVTNFCRQNPLDHVSNAALGLVGELFTRK
jgi:hypothetical protein